MVDYEYFRLEESEQFSFFRIPKALFTEKEFSVLSTDAKLLYGILLDRLSLSKKNGWVDADGYVYIIYTLEELQNLLAMSHNKVIKLLYELDSEHGIGLIERYRQGCNRPSIIYVKNFIKNIPFSSEIYEIRKNERSGNLDCTKREVRIAQKRKSGMNKMRSPDCTKKEGSNTNINKTENNDTDLIKEKPETENKTCAFGRFQNVFMNQKEYQSLKDNYPYDYDKLIDRLSDYMKSTGKTYKNHFATICLWAEKDEKRSKIRTYEFKEGECL